MNEHELSRLEMDQFRFDINNNNYENNNNNELDIEFCFGDKISCLNETKQN